MLLKATASVVRRRPARKRLSKPHITTRLLQIVVNSVASLCDLLLLHLACGRVCSCRALVGAF